MTQLPHQPITPPLASGLSSLIASYDVVISDVWGVLHNGVRAYPAASHALGEARRAGKPVILVSNAPRQGRVVIEQLDKLGVPRSSYDAIVTSGDVSLHEMKRRRGQKIYHIGPSRDDVLFEDFQGDRVPLDEADYIICTGLVDDARETPDDYRALLEKARARNLFFLCGNPDKVVEVGEHLLYCAGALGDLYAEMGGEVLYAGKPFAPAYELALSHAETLTGVKADPARVLAIGDAMRTDVAGALRMGFDSLFLANGIHAAEITENSVIKTQEMSKLIADHGLHPSAMMFALSWS